MTGIAPEVRATRALARSVLWQAASLGLRPPGPLTAARLHAQEGVRSLALAAATAFPEIEGAVEALGRGDAPDPGEFARLFGHTSRGLVPPYEMEWGPDELFLKPHELADLQGVLAAFGLALGSGERERVDHVATQCEMLAFLAAREARAIEDGDGEAEAAAVRGQAIVLGEHLGRFAPAFARRLAQEAGEGFLARLARLLGALVAAECARQGLEPGNPGLSLRPTARDEQPVECGPGDDLVQIRGASRPERGA